MSLTAASAPPTLSEEPEHSILICGHTGPVRDAVERALTALYDPDLIHVLDPLIDDLGAIRASRTSRAITGLSPRTVIHLDPAVNQPPSSANAAMLAGVLDGCAQADSVEHLVYVGSTLVYPCRPGTPSIVPESMVESAAARRPDHDGYTDHELAAVAAERAVHDLARSRRGRVRATVLRSVPILGAGVRHSLTAYLRLPTPPKPFGYDARLQFVHLDDLAQAVAAAVSRRVGGTFNIAADGVVLLSQLIRMAGRQPLPVPHRILVRCVTAAGVRGFDTVHAELLRFGRCLETTRARDLLGWQPLRSTEQAVRDHLSPSPHRAPIPWPRRTETPLPATVLATALGPHTAERALKAGAFAVKRLTGGYRIDVGGYDEHYYRHCIEPVLKLLFEHYFRVEVHGLENVPNRGATLLVSNHSGTLPLDALMLGYALHNIHPAHRVPRMLAGDLLYSFPFIGDTLRKTGFITATREDAAHFLHRGELACVFPEGYKGLGKPFRHRYQLQRFGRGGFAKTAVTHHALVIPTAVIGAEEIYPMLGNAQALARRFALPYIPITPTFPWLGPLGLLPLRSRWTIAFGKPLDPADYSAADDHGDGADGAARLAEDTETAIKELIERELGRQS